MKKPIKNDVPEMRMRADEFDRLMRDVLQSPRTAKAPPEILTKKTIVRLTKPKSPSK